MTAPDDAIADRERSYIAATAAVADDRTCVLKHGDTFAIFDRHGDIGTAGSTQQGVFQGDTRMLSQLELRVGGARPVLLSSAVTDDNSVLMADLTVPDLELDGRTLARDTVHILRSVCLWQETCFIRVRVHNFAGEPLRLPLELLFGADFADIFEVRGTGRARRGDLLPADTGPDRVRLAYDGLDGRRRAVSLRFEPAPDRLSGSAAGWDVALAPGEQLTVRLAVCCGRDGAEPEALYFEAARAAHVAALSASADDACHIDTSSEQFNRWLTRSAADLRMLLTRTPSGPYPYAGVPWFSTAFGRDGIITALQTLWVDPSIAAGVLRFLSAAQASETIPEQEAEPGKIVHEMRSGEMAALGEVPFARYYGTVDATPLFVLLAAAYLDTTGDAALIDQIWPHIERALTWMDRHGDADGDGLLEYTSRPGRGLLHQGWKDSADPISHADGQGASGAIAVCEVQGYAHAAWNGAARLADALGRADDAGRHRARGEALRATLERDYWCEELGTYGLALDGDKRLCRVRSSNAGHLLFTGTASPDRAARVARTLMADDSFSGWGVRTLSARERRYNPMSYHNGSVWPHDNALIAAGMARYGLRGPVLDILGALFDASTFIDLHRMPELFCGFARRPSEGPTRYPVACAPQAWAAGAVYMLLQACLGMTIDGRARTVRFERPALPAFLDQVRVTGLRIGDARVDLELVRGAADVRVHVARREGQVDVVVVK